MKSQRKLFAFPHAFALMFGITIFMAILTWILPAGVYDVDPQTKRVIANSYHQIAQHPQGLWDIFHAVTKGCAQSAVMMTMVFFIGGAVAVIEETGTISNAMGSVMNLFKGKEMWATAFIMAFISIVGATGSFANSSIAAVPLGIVLAKSMGYDSVVGAALIYLGAYIGFNVGWGNVFTIGIANQIAELPILEGFGVRVALHIINAILTIGFVLMYMRKIKNDPTKSLAYDPDEPAPAVTASESAKMTGVQKICGIVVIIGFGFIVTGALRWKWGISESTTCFFIMSILCGLIGGLGVNGTCKTFVKGMGKMAYAAYIIGFARAISVIMTDGKIIHTVVYYLSLPISKVGPVLGANLMLAANVIINFFISSGSGQANAVMPLMVPLADLTGISREVAVQAYQFGDGFTNCIIPTSGVLMGVLGLIGVSWAKWAKWYLPLLLAQLVVAVITITAMQMYAM